MQEAFAQPGVEVSSKTCRCDLTGLLTGMDVFELSKHSGTTGNEETMVGGQDLLCKVEITRQRYVDL